MTFTPAPGSAPFLRQVRAQSAMEVRLLLRNGEQLLLAAVIPVLALVAGVFGARRLDLSFDHDPVDVLAPGVLALAIMSTAFASLAIATGFERRYGLLKRLGSSPLPRTGLLAGKVVALLCVQAAQCLVVGAVAVGLGWRPGSATGVALAVVAALLGTAAFGSLGLALAGAVRAEATLAIANLVYLLLMAGGAVVLPRDSYGAAAGVLQVLPSAALGDAFRAALIDGRPDLVAWAVLAGWAVLGTLLASRFFKWE
ncbi:ABC transporter permease [Nocardioides limicola]|uniref:ABC transporter permease n=1 Tax=Nocardioides limicola TaxID=2803368 RepID=UPI00193B9B4C|nr:ABC transporter permease [Nocardioides sp. DJM-14]